jgi:hypothetical protein
MNDNDDEELAGVTESGLKPTARELTNGVGAAPTSVFNLQKLDQTLQNSNQLQ